MSFYHNEREMYIPMSIDSAENTKGSYFFSSMKIVEMALALVPYLVLMYPMLQGGVNLLPIVIITIVYGILYIYFFRFRILEEGRLRRMIKELDNNKRSDLGYFWEINPISNKGNMDGVIQYERNSGQTQQGVVVTYERGSLIGIPDGSYRMYREAKMDFIRELYTQGFDFTWYEIPKRGDDIPPSLMYYFNQMTMMDNQAYKQLLKLQIDINVMYTMGEGVTYQDYILIRNKRFNTMARFKEIVTDIVDRTLNSNSYIVNARVLNKRGVEQFLGDVFMVNPVDSDSVRRGTRYRRFDEFAEVVRVIDSSGKDLPLEFLELYDLYDDSKTKSVEDLLREDLKRKEKLLEEIDTQEELAEKKITSERTRDEIDDREYRDLIKAKEREYAELREVVRNTTYGELDEKDIREKMRIYALRPQERKRVEERNKRKAEMEKRRLENGGEDVYDLEEVMKEQEIGELEINVSDDLLGEEEKDTGDIEDRIGRNKPTVKKQVRVQRPRPVRRPQPDGRKRPKPESKVEKKAVKKVVKRPVQKTPVNAKAPIKKTVPVKQKAPVKKKVPKQVQKPNTPKQKPSTSPTSPTPKTKTVKKQKDVRGQKQGVGRLRPTNSDTPKGKKVVRRKKRPKK